MKTCFKCGVPKPLHEFYRHSQMADGHLNKCKGCSRSDANANRTSRLEYYRLSDMERYYRDGHRGKPSKEAHNAASARWNAANKEKRAAYSKVAYAVLTGKLVKPVGCETCGRPEALQAHHEDYFKPLEVRWLCAACHKTDHRKHDPDTVISQLNEMRLG